MKAEKIDHVMIVVRDAEKAKRFFADLLGTEFSESQDSKQMDVKGTTICPIGIRLFGPLTPDGPVARRLERTGEGLTALSLEIKNLDEALAELESRGIRVLARSEHDREVLGEKLKWQRARRRIAVLHPKDTYGVMIELTEYLD